jgi:hypothetical protein
VEHLQAKTAAAAAAAVQFLNEGCQDGQQGRAMPQAQQAEEGHLKSQGSRITILVYGDNGHTASKAVHMRECAPL